MNKPVRERETRPEVLARRDVYAKELVESFERDGLDIMPSFVRWGAEVARDIKVQPRPANRG